MVLVSVLILLLLLCFVWFCFLFFILGKECFLDTDKRRVGEGVSPKKPWGQRDPVLLEKGKDVAPSCLWMLFADWLCLLL